MRKWLYKSVIQILNLRKRCWDKLPFKKKEVVIDRKDRLGDLVITLPLVEALAKQGCSVTVGCSQDNIALVDYLAPFSGQVSFRLIEEVNQYPEIYLDLFYKEWSRALKRFSALKPKCYYGFCKYPKYGLCSDDYALFDRCEPFEESLRVIDNQRRLFNRLFDENYDMQAWRKLFPGFMLGNRLIKAETLQGTSRVYDVLLSLQGSAVFRQLHVEGIIYIARVLKGQGLNVVVPWPGSIPQGAEDIFLSTKGMDEFIHAISESRVVVSVDSAAVHFASFLNTPVIGIYMHYKPTGVRFYPFSDRFEVIYRERLDVLNSNDDYASLANEIFKSLESLQCKS